MSKISSILGYSVVEYVDFYKLYMHEKKQEPADLFDLMDFWERQPRRTPRDCSIVAMKLSAAYEIDASLAVRLVEGHLLRMNNILGSTS